MGADYIPEQDFYAEIWLRNFAGTLAADTAGYLATTADALDAVAAATVFSAALKATQTPGVQSSPLIRAKNDARRSAESVMRPMAQRIRRDRRIDSTLKIRIGLTPPATRRQTVEPPQSTPQLIARSRSGVGGVEIFVMDSASQRRKRPAAAMGLALYQRIVPLAAVEALGLAYAAGTGEGILPAVDGEPPVAVEHPWTFIGVYSAWPINLDPAIERTGDVVGYAARWITRQGECGPFGVPTSIRPQYNTARALGMKTSSRRHLAA